MRKWLVAFALCLTLCLCTCAALADDHLTITVSNAEIQNGAVSGAYYYKLYADTNLNSFLMGWGVDVSAAEPEEGEWYPTSLDYWYQDDNGYFIVTTPPSSGDYSADVMFYRIGEDDPWQKIVFNYDLSLTATAELTGMTAEGPSMFEEDFTLEWDAVEGADAYVVYVKRPDFGEQPARYMTPGNSLTIKAPAYGEEQNRLWPVGEYECSVVAMANQQLISFTNAAAYTVSPVLGLSPWNEDFVVPNGDGSGASIKLNQWMQLAATAPGANLVRVHQLDTGDEELNDDNIFEVVWPGDYGAGEFSWIGVGQPQGFSKILVAEAEMPDGATYLSSPFTIQVGYDGEIEEDVVYTVSHTDNVYDEETGRFIVARDGMLYVDVENMDVNFFGLYIGQWENGNWLADSHWINLSDGQTTRVPLTVPRCQAGQDYEVHVCAVRFGCPQKDAEITIPIHVTEAATDCDIIVTMEREYIVGQSLRVFAHYTNPDDIDGFMQIRIREKGGEDNVVYAEMGDFYDYWDNDAVIWQSGTFVVDARIMQFGENGAFVREDHPEIWEFTVNANGQVAAPHVKAFSTFPAGQDLILNLYAEASEDEEMPDWFEASLFRVDGDGFIGSAMTEDIVDGQGTLMISKDRFEAGGLYWIRLFGMKYGCEVGVTEFRFLVTDETAMEQDLILTVNGSFDEEQEVLSSAELSVRVAYEGKRPTAIRILNGDRWEYWRGDDRFTWDWGFGDSEILIYAEGTDDEIDFEALNEYGWEGFDWNKDVNWTRKSNLIRLNVGSPYGKMSAPECSIENPEMDEGGSGMIPWGDSVSLLIADAAPMVLDPEGGEAQPVENGWFYCNLYVQRWNENGDPWWDRIDQEYHYDVHSGLNSIYTYNLEGGCRYQLEIGADGEGYSGRSSRIEFELGEKPEEPEEAVKLFTVNGDSEYLTLQTREDMQLAAYYSYAERYVVEIYREDEDDWFEDMHGNWNGMYLDSWCANEEGDYTLQAYACGYLRDEQGNIIEDENGDDEWRELIGTVNVTVSAKNGDLDPVVASISTEKAYVGDDITLTFSGPNSAENFNYWVHPVDGWWVAGNGQNRAGATSFSTDTLESGVYCVEVDAQALGYNQSHKTLYFALLDENDAEFSNENRIFTISATEVPTETDVRIIAYLPGADAVEAYFSKDGGELEDFRHENVPGLSTWFSRGDAGSYDIYVSGEYDGVWSRPGFVCTLEITAENEFDSVPEVTVNGSIQENIVPLDEIDPQRLNISFLRDENAQGYHLMVRKYGDGWLFFDRYVDLNDPDEDTPFVIGEDTVSVTIEDENIRQGGFYEIECYAHAPGYECAGSSRVFLLQPTSQQNLTVTVNGSAEEEQDMLSSANLFVRVAYEGDRPTAVRILNGDHWEYWWGNERFARDWNFGDSEILIYAEGTDDEIDFEALMENEWEDFDWNTDVNWNRRSNLVRVNVGSPYGEMSAPSFTIENAEMGEGGSGVIPWGDTLAVLLADPGPMVLDPEGGEAQAAEDGWFFCNLYVQRWNDDGAPWWDHVNRDYGYPIHSGLNVIPTFNLDGGCRYQLEIGADGEGYSGRSSRIEFELGERQEDPDEPLKVFTVNHETANLTVQTYEEMQLVAYHSDAEWYGVEIYREDDEGWYEDRNNNWNGMLMDSWRANEAGSYTLEAYAYGGFWDEEGNRIEDENGNDEWRELIGTVNVTVSAKNGDLDPVVASISTEKAYVGDDITLTFSGPNSAENFNYWVHPVDGWWVAGNGQNRAGATSFSTDTLESGVYCVEVDAQALGYNQSHKTLYFALLDENDAEFSNENRIFTISATEVTTGTDVRIIAYLPGADAVETYFSKDGGDLEGFIYAEGPGMGDWFRRGDSGSYAFYVSGEYDGEWSEPEQVCTLEITAEYEFASAPMVTVNGSAQGAAAPTDENDPHRLNVSIQRDEEAQGYHLMIREYGDRWILFDWFVDLNAEENGTPFEISGDTVSVSIWDERIEPGRVYTLECSAHAQNYECSGTSRTFLLQRDGQQAVTLNVSPINDEGFWTGREVQVTASAPNATALYIRMNNEDHWYRGDTMNERWNIWDMGTMFYAYATTDPIPEDDGFLWSELNVDWSMQSEPIWIEADTLGDTEIPSLAFDNQVAKGEWLEITIGDDADVRQIDVRISDDNGEIYEFRRYWSPGTYRIATANLNADQRYWVWLSCVQDQHLWTNGPGIALYVGDPAGDAAFFRADKTTLYPHENFIPVVYAPGALHIWIEETSDGGLWGDWNGENATNDADWDWWYEDPGEYSLTAWAQYPNQDERTRIGDLVFTIVEPTMLDAPEISAPLEADVTQDIQIIVAPVEYGYDYYLQLHYFDQENEWIGWGKTVKDVDQESGQLVWTVPVGTLEANKPYWIDVYAAPARDDYAHADSSASICIMTVDGDARDEGITLAVVPGSNVTATDEGFSVPINTDFGITVSANGGTLPTAIAVYMGDRTAYRFFNDADGSAETEYVTMNEYQPWPEMIFARACYDDLSGYDGWDDVPWSELNWGSVSNAVQVNFTANGLADPPEINCNWATIVGRDMVVTVTLGDNANEAHANIDRILGGWQQDLVFDRWIPWEPTEGSENQGTITIPTDGLAVGAYRLYVDNSGEGYDNSRATKWFHIAEDPYESASKLVLPAGLKTIEDEAFEGIAAETVIIPEGVTSIGSGAFRNSSVRLVVIPASVTFIGDDAFAGTNLYMVYGFNDGPALQLVHDTDAAAFCFIGE